MPFDPEDFEKKSAKWKPPGYDCTMDRRLRFLDGDARGDVQKELRVQYPETWQGMSPVVRNPVPLVVSERARTFQGSSWHLRVRGGEDLPAEDERAQLFARLWKRAGMQLLLEETDRYVEGLGAVFIRLGFDARRRCLTAGMWLPQRTDAALDPDRPAELDLAEGITLDLASSEGLKSSEGCERRELWSARPGHEAHLVLVGDDIFPPSADNPEMLNPYVGVEEPGMEPAALVPIVAFSLAARDRGLYLITDEDLYAQTLDLSCSATDLREIGRHQGFGELYVKPAASGGSERQEGGGTRARGPSVAQVLAPGEEVELLSPTPAIEALRQGLVDDTKHIAVSRGVPAGSVLADSRTVASAAALAIERLPLIEYRTKSIARYRPAIERLWYVFRSVWRTHAEPLGLVAFGDDLELVWTPGDPTYRGPEAVPQAAPAWMTRNEWRAKNGLGPLRMPSGEPDPRGYEVPDLPAMPAPQEAS